MKKVILFVLILFALTFVSAASIASSSNLRVTLVNQEPDPAEPGSYMDVRFRIENYGSGNAEFVEFEIIPEYPLLDQP